MGVRLREHRAIPLLEIILLSTDVRGDVGVCACACVCLPVGVGEEEARDDDAALERLRFLTMIITLVRNSSR